MKLVLLVVYLQLSFSSWIFVFTALSKSLQLLLNVVTTTANIKEARFHHRFI